MSRSRYWWACVATAVVSLCSVAVNAARWIGSEELLEALAPLGLAPFFAGTIVAHGAYFIAQTLPDGRGPVWLPRAPSDGWALVLALATVCAGLSGAPIRPGGPDQMLLAVPFVMVSTFFLIDRVRRVQRVLAHQPTSPT